MEEEPVRAASRYLCKRHVLPFQRTVVAGAARTDRSEAAPAAGSAYEARPIPSLTTIFLEGDIPLFLFLNPETWKKNPSVRQAGACAKGTSFRFKG